MVATFCVYSQVQDHEFVSYDDPLYTYPPNQNVKAGFNSKSVKWAFTTMYSEEWSPVNWLSHILDHQLSGMNPKGHHLTNLFFHTANALLLFIVLHRMTGALWQSAFVAAIFAFHPLNVESVAWLAGRKNVLSTFFGLLTIYAYIGYAAKKTIRRYSLVFLFFALGLMSKSMLVTLPFVLLLLDYWPLERLKFSKESDCSKTVNTSKANGQKVLRLVGEKIPLFLLSVVCSILNFVAATALLQAFSIPLKERIIHSLITYLAYLQKMFWPSKLSHFYPYPENDLSVVQGIFCGMALVGITFISIRLIRKAPYFVVGWFWYLGTLVPVIGIFVQAGWAGMADRYTYIPLVGIFIIIAWGFPELISNWRHKKKVLVTLAIIVIPSLMMVSWVQVSYWKNDIVLYKHAIDVAENKYPGLAKTYNNLGIALFAKQENEEAISYYKMAIKLNPNYTNAHYNLGIVLLQKGEMKEAAHHFRETIELRPDFIAARDNLEFALLQSQEIE